MAHKEIVLKVFVASPSDVSAERDTLEDVIRKINRIWSEKLALRFDLIRWETHTVPGFGTDSQDVINRQISDHYDVFIGIMWARFGTTTGRAGSGTEEEFERAYSKFCENSDSIDILMYFKGGDIPVDDVNVEQLSKVRNFQKKIGNLGGLYARFRDTEEFETLAHLHLTRIMQNWAEKSKSTTQQTKISAEHLVNRDVEARSEYKLDTNRSTSSDDYDISNDEDLGYLDYIEIFEDKFILVEEITNQLNHSMTGLTHRIQRRTEQFNELKDDSSFSSRSVKRITNQVADDLNLFCKEMRGRDELFRMNFNLGITAILKAFELSEDFYQSSEGEEIELRKNEVREAMFSTSSLKKTISDAAESLRKMGGTAESLPRATKQFNVAKRGVKDTVDAISREFVHAIRMLDEVEETVGKLLC